MAAHPLVTVLMPVRDGERFLEEAVASVLAQTYESFELLIVDGGSGSATIDLLRRLEARDDRIRLELRDSFGLAASLHLGCQRSRGQYIARMDADDVSEPTRLDHQVAFLERHRDVGVAGSHFLNIDETGRPLDVYRVQTSPFAAKWIMMFGTCVAHPTVMMRRPTVERVGFYDAGARYSEDYELWSRLVRDTEFSNVPEVLVRRRVWGGNKGDRDAPFNQRFNAKLMHRVVQALLGLDVTEDEVLRLRRLMAGDPLTGRAEVFEAAGLLRGMLRGYLASRAMSREDRRAVVADAAQKTVLAARAARAHSSALALRLFARAVRLSPRLINYGNFRKAMQPSAGKRGAQTLPSAGPTS